MTTKIALDGIFFSMSSSGIAHYWIRLLNSIEAYQHRSGVAAVSFTIFIDDNIIESNLKALSTFNILTKRQNVSYAMNVVGCEDPNSIFTDSIEKSGLVFDIAMSTFHTISYKHYNLGVIHDFIPERLGVWSKQSPFWLYKLRYMHTINSCIFVSNSTYSDWKIISSPCASNLDSRTAIIYPVIDHSISSIYPGDRADRIRFERITNMIKLSRKSVLISGGSLLQSHKATEDAIKACARVLTSLPNSSIIITGACITNEDKSKAIRLARLCSMHKLHLIFQSYSGLDYLLKLFQIVSVVLCPSKLEGFGMPVAEALFAGSNVVARRNAGMHEAGGSLARYFSDFEKDFDKVLLYSLSNKKDSGMIHKELHFRKFTSTNIAIQFIEFIGVLEAEGLRVNDYLL